MSDPTRGGGYKRKPRRGTADSLQLHRQQAHDELDDSRLNDDQARDKNAARIHDSRAITDYLHDNDDSNGDGYQAHMDSAGDMRDRVMRRTAKMNADIAKEKK